MPNKPLRITAIISILISSAGYACSPLPPVILPPDTVDGEFTYVSITPEASAAERLREANDIAVVTIISDSRIDDLWVAKIQIHFGWGFQKARYLDFVRISNSCGEPELLADGEKYAAILIDGEVAEVIKLALAQTHIETLGEPRYRYSNAGLTINE